jgi:phosphoribosyl-AMP cyclohydrolase / phosphoribosyl-ATP pyrophosphohydrolase
MTLTDSDLAQLDFAKSDGLVTAVVQHADSGAVLMVGHMNRAAVEATLQRRRAVFYSRSKQRLWEKGETSGHTLELVDVIADCDRDCLLVLARPHGPACHTGTATCFGDAPRAAAERLAFIAELERVIEQRAADRPEGSYTARLLAEGPKRLAQKVGEEGVETALAGVGEDESALVAESADLLFHLMLLLRARGIPLDRVVSELAARHRAKQ